MFKFLLHIKTNLKLLSRISFLGKEKISFLIVGSIGFIFLYVLCWKTNLYLNEISSSLLIISGLYYHGFESKNSFNSFHYFPIYIDQNQSLINGLKYRMLLILIICSPFIFSIQHINFFESVIFITTIGIFNSLVYLLSDLALLNKGFFYLFRFLTLSPIFFIDLSEIWSEESIQSIFISSENVNIVLLGQLFIFFILFIGAYFTHRKKFYDRLI